MAPPTLTLFSPGELLSRLGKRVQQLRLLRNVTQAELAERAGVGVKALRRLESSGEGTLDTAVLVAIALGCGDAFEHLFELPAVRSMADLDSEEQLVTRRRARRRRA